ncbi:MAG: hypothetical protein M3550_02960, partial [Actinomycetota bacterium]|nr:hypothetical protein [Actinomycetota bacterium]
PGRASLLAGRGDAGAGDHRNRGGRGAVRHAPAARSGPSAGRNSDFVRSLSAAPPARYDPEAGTLFSDTPGSLPVSAVVGSEEPTGDRCDITVTTTLSLLSPRPWQVGALFTPARSQRSSSTRPLEFSFRVMRPSTGVDLRPVTARARVVRKLRFPGAGARAKARTFDLRAADGDDFASGGGCPPVCESRRSPGVIVRRSGGGFAVEVGPLPISEPPQAAGGLRIARPYGVDVELLQGGRRIAWLRVARRCDGFVGLSSALIRCPKPKISRKLG